MPDLPDYITHYHLPDRAPFLNLSDLDDDRLAAVLSELATTGGSQRRFGPAYMRLRRGTERLLRERFLERGGRPIRQSPHYFVLGESAWFRGLYRDAREVRLRLVDLPADQVSFTIPDSITSMGLLARLGHAQPIRPHHGAAFRLDELAEVVERYGRPDSPAPASYDGHQLEEFEHYVEVQVWSDDAVGLSDRRRDAR
jgi:hypothetical protein